LSSVPQYRNPDAREMATAERREFCRKAKADRLAFEAAELLRGGKAVESAALIEEGAAIVGRDRLASSFRHYAVNKFRVDLKHVDNVLAAIAGEAVAA
jgi:hypothetical protein